MNLSNKTALIYDYGLFTEVGARLARDFAKVYYYVPWEEAFPHMSKALIGTGYGEMERIRNFEEYIDKADIIVFPDTHSGSKVEFLRGKGYNVAGVGKYEELELDRWKMRKIQERLGLPTQETHLIKGISNLKDHLQTVKGKYVKLNIFRGDIESFFHEDYESSLPILNHLQYDLGPKGDSAEFIVEDKVEGAEPGLDCIVYDGEVLSPTMYGYEVRGAGYIGKVVPYAQVPKQLKMVTDKLMSVMGGYRFFFSSEVMIPNGHEGFLIDPCCRFAAPAVNAIELELIENFSEVMYGLAVGQKVLPIMKYKYAAGIVMYSDWADSNWLNVSVPKELREYVKMRMVAQFDDELWSVSGHSTICTVIAFADTAEKAAKLAVERAKEIKGYQLAGGEEDINKVFKAIAEGKKHGISF